MVELIVECPRNTNLEHARIKRISRYGKVFVVYSAEEIAVPMLILQQYSHTLPLRRDKGIEIWIISNFCFVLVVEYRQRRIVALRIIAGIETAINTYLQTQDIAFNPKFVVVRKECRYQRQWHNITV